LSKRRAPPFAQEGSGEYRRYVASMKNDLKNASQNFPQEQSISTVQSVVKNNYGYFTN
jgi:hypothetical protein